MFAVFQVPNRSGREWAHFEKIAHLGLISNYCRPNGTADAILADTFGAKTGILAELMLILAELLQTKGAFRTEVRREKVHSWAHRRDANATSDVKHYDVFCEQT